MTSQEFEDLETGLVVFAPLKMEHKIQYVRVLDAVVVEDEPTKSRWLVIPDNERGASGAVEPYWVEHPWKVVSEEEADAIQN